MPSNFRALLLPSLPRHADMLGNRHFLIAVGAALLLHLIAMIIWHLSPKTEVVDIPVRALSIKLTDGDALSAEAIRKAAPVTGNYTDVENTITRLIREQETQAAREKTAAKPASKPLDEPSKTPKVVQTPRGKIGTLHKFDMRSEGVKAAAPVMQVQARQFVRDLAPPVATTKAEPQTQAGNSASAAEVLARYEQLISLWIQKFKQYPEEAKSAGLKGETLVRIRIDRRGNIRYYALERSTGHVVLDRAAVDMVRRANPVPGVPGNYPAGGDMLEFLIPVNFHLQ